MNLEVTEVFDLRTFIRPSPIYLSPMTTGSVNNQSNRVDSAADLDNLFGADESGGLSSSNFGALWQSYSFGTDGTDGDQVLYFSGKQGGSRRTHRLGPNKLSVLNTAQTFRFDGPNFFNATPASGDINITPTGTFPPSHMVIVNNAQTSTHKVIFDPNGLSNGGATVGDVGPSSGAIFVYNGSAWVKIFSSSTTSTSASGSAGAIQLSDGSSAFTNDTDLSFTTGTNTLNVGGPIIMGGALLKQPTGIQFTKVDDNPGGTAFTLWVDEDDGDKLKFGTSAVQLADANAQFSLNDLSAGAIDVAADSIAFIDANDSNNSKKESVADLATAMAGTGISASSGALNLDANLSAVTNIGPAGNLTVNQDLIVTGTLTVNGATTTINSTTLTVDDKLIELAHSPSGSEGNDAAVDGGGIILKSSDSDKSIVFTDSTDSWTFNQHLFPSADSSKNFGSDTVRWATGFLDTVNTADLVVDTSLIKTDSANNFVGINQASPQTDFQVKELGFGYGTVDTDSSSTGTPLTINLFKRQEFKAAKLLVSVENNTDGVYETAEMVMTHSGTASGSDIADGDVFVSVYGVVTTSSTQQGTYSASQTGSGANQYIQLKVTPTVNSKDIDVRVSWQALTI